MSRIGEEKLFKKKYQSNIFKKKDLKKVYLKLPSSAM